MGPPPRISIKGPHGWGSYPCGQKHVAIDGAGIVGNALNPSHLLSRLSRKMPTNGDRHL